MTHRTLLDDVIPEGTTARITGTFRDDAGALLGSARFVSLLLTLYDRITNAAINGRTHVPVLNTGGGSVSTTGDFAFDLLAADNIMVNAGREREHHIALLEYVYDTNRVGKSEIVFTVANLPLVP